MMVDDGGVVDREALSTGALRTRTGLALGKMRLVKRLAPMKTFWEGAVQFAQQDGAIAVRLEAGGSGDAPERAQLEFMAQLEAKFVQRMASALVLLKPAFTKYVGTQAVPKRMDVEFHVTGIYIPCVTEGLEVATAWEVMLRCETAPEFEFVVRFCGERPSELLVDRTWLDDHAQSVT